MRPCGGIRALGAGLAVVLCASSPASVDAQADWLPEAERVERPERLDEPPPPTPATMSAVIRAGAGADGSISLRRVAASVRWGLPGREPRVSLDAAVVLDAGGARRPGVSLCFGAWGASGGWLTADEAPVLLARRLGVVRQSSRVPEASAVGFRAQAPLSASAPSFMGGSLARGGRDGTAWAFAGRRAGAEAWMGAAGLAVRRPRWAAAVAAARADSTWFASGGGQWLGPRAAVTGEVLLERGRASLLARVETRGSPLGLRARWRFEPADSRPSALEAGATWRARPGSLRLTWHSWTRAARGDNGALELEAAGAIGRDRPVRLRLVERAVPPTGPGAGAAGTGAAGAGRRGAAEHYALLDATLARDGARSLAAVGSVRGITGGRATSRSLGGRLRLGRDGGVARLELLALASRSRAGAPALVPALHASGEATLAERVRSGISVASRGIVRRGPFELGGALEREEDAGGARSRSATIWLRFVHRSPSGSGREAAGPLP